MSFAARTPPLVLPQPVCSCHTPASSFSSAPSNASIIFDITNRGTSGKSSCGSLMSSDSPSNRKASASVLSVNTPDMASGRVSIGSHKNTTPQLTPPTHSQPTASMEKGQAGKGQDALLDDAAHLHVKASKAARVDEEFQSTSTNDAVRTSEDNPNRICLSSSGVTSEEVSLTPQPSRDTSLRDVSAVSSLPAAARLARKLERRISTTKVPVMVLPASVDALSANHSNIETGTDRIELSMVLRGNASGGSDCSRRSTTETAPSTIPHPPTVVAAQALARSRQSSGTHMPHVRSQGAELVFTPSDTTTANATPAPLTVSNTRVTPHRRFWSMESSTSICAHAAAASPSSTPLGVMSVTETEQEKGLRTSTPNTATAATAGPLSAIDAALPRQMAANTNPLASPSATPANSCSSLQYRRHVRLRGMRGRSIHIRSSLSISSLNSSCLASGFIKPNAGSNDHAQVIANLPCTVRGSQRRASLEGSELSGSAMDAGTFDSAAAFHSMLPTMLAMRPTTQDGFSMQSSFSAITSSSSTREKVVPLPGLLEASSNGSAPPLCSATAEGGGDATQPLASPVMHKAVPVAVTTAQTTSASTMSVSPSSLPLVGSTKSLATAGAGSGAQRTPPDSVSTCATHASTANAKKAAVPRRSLRRRSLKSRTLRIASVSFSGMADVAATSSVLDIPEAKPSSSNADRSGGTRSLTTPDAVGTVGADEATPVQRKSSSNRKHTSNANESCTGSTTPTKAAGSAVTAAAAVGLPPLVSKFSLRPLPFMCAPTPFPDGALRSPSIHSLVSASAAAAIAAMNASQSNSLQRCDNGSSRPATTCSSGRRLSQRSSSALCYVTEDEKLSQRKSSSSASVTATTRRISTSILVSPAPLTLAPQAPVVAVAPETTIVPLCMSPSTAAASATPDPTEKVVSCSSLASSSLRHETMKAVRMGPLGIRGDDSESPLSACATRPSMQESGTDQSKGLSASPPTTYVSPAPSVSGCAASIKQAVLPSGTFVGPETPQQPLVAALVSTQARPLTLITSTTSPESSSMVNDSSLLSGSSAHTHRFLLNAHGGSADSIAGSPISAAVTFPSIPGCSVCGATAAAMTTTTAASGMPLQSHSSSSNVSLALLSTTGIAVEMLRGKHGDGVAGVQTGGAGENSCDKDRQPPPPGTLSSSPICSSLTRDGAVLNADSACSVPHTHPFIANFASDMLPPLRSPENETPQTHHFHARDEAHSPTREERSGSPSDATSTKALKGASCVRNAASREASIPRGGTPQSISPTAPAIECVQSQGLQGLQKCTVGEDHMDESRPPLQRGGQVEGSEERKESLLIYTASAASSTVDEGGTRPPGVSRTTDSANQKLSALETLAELCSKTSSRDLKMPSEAVEASSESAASPSTGAAASATSCAESTAAPSTYARGSASCQQEKSASLPYFLELVGSITTQEMKEGEGRQSDASPRPRSEPMTCLERVGNAKGGDAEATPHLLASPNSSSPPQRQGEQRHSRASGMSPGLIEAPVLPPVTILGSYEDVAFSSTSTSEYAAFGDCSSSMPQLRGTPRLSCLGSRIFRERSLHSSGDTTTLEAEALLACPWNSNVASGSVNFMASRNSTQAPSSWNSVVQLAFDDNAQAFRTDNAPSQTEEASAFRSSSTASPLPEVPTDAQASMVRGCLRSKTPLAKPIPANVASPASRSPQPMLDGAVQEPHAEQRRPSDTPTKRTPGNEEEHDATEPVPHLPPQQPPSPHCRQSNQMRHEGFQACQRSSAVPTSQLYESQGKVSFDLCGIAPFNRSIQEEQSSSPTPSLQMPSSLESIVTVAASCSRSGSSSSCSSCLGSAHREPSLPDSTGRRRPWVVDAPEPAAIPYPPALHSAGVPDDDSDQNSDLSTRLPAIPASLNLTALPKARKPESSPHDGGALSLGIVSTWMKSAQSLLSFPGQLTSLRVPLSSSVTAAPQCDGGSSSSSSATQGMRQLNSYPLRKRVFTSVLHQPGPTESPFAQSSRASTAYSATTASGGTQSHVLRPLDSTLCGSSWRWTTAQASSTIGFTPISAGSTAVGASTHCRWSLSSTLKRKWTFSMASIHGNMHPLNSTNQANLPPAPSCLSSVLPQPLMNLPTSPPGSRRGFGNFKFELEGNCSGSTGSDSASGDTISCGRLSPRTHKRKARRKHSSSTQGLSSHACAPSAEGRRSGQVVLMDTSPSTPVERLRPPTKTVSFERQSRLLHASPGGSAEDAAVCVTSPRSALEKQQQQDSRRSSFFRFPKTSPQDTPLETLALTKSAEGSAQGFAGMQRSIDSGESWLATVLPAVERGSGDAGQLTGWTPSGVSLRFALSTTSLVDLSMVSSVDAIQTQQSGQDASADTAEHIEARAASTPTTAAATAASTAAAPAPGSRSDTHAAPLNRRSSQQKDFAVKSFPLNKRCSCRSRRRLSKRSSITTGPSVSPTFLSILNSTSLCSTNGCASNKVTPLGTASARAAPSASPLSGADSGLLRPLLNTSRSPPTVTLPFEAASKTVAMDSGFTALQLQNTLPMVAGLGAALQPSPKSCGDRALTLSPLGLQLKPERCETGGGESNGADEGAGARPAGASPSPVLCARTSPSPTANAAGDHNEFTAFAPATSVTSAATTAAQPVTSVQHLPHLHRMQSITASNALIPAPPATSLTTTGCSTRGRRLGSMLTAHHSSAGGMLGLVDPGNAPQRSGFLASHSRHGSMMSELADSAATGHTSNGGSSPLACSLLYVPVELRRGSEWRHLQQLIARNVARSRQREAARLSFSQVARDSIGGCPRLPTARFADAPSAGHEEKRNGLRFHPAGRLDTPIIEPLLFPVLAGAPHRSDDANGAGHLGRKVLMRSNNAVAPSSHCSERSRGLAARSPNGCPITPPSPPPPGAQLHSSRLVGRPDGTAASDNCPVNLAHTTTQAHFQPPPLLPTFAAAESPKGTEAGDRVNHLKRVPAVGGSSAGDSPSIKHEGSEGHVDQHSTRKVRASEGASEFSAPPPCLPEDRQLSGETKAADETRSGDCQVEKPDISNSTRPLSWVHSPQFPPPRHKRIISGVPLIASESDGEDMSRDVSSDSGERRRSIPSVSDGGNGAAAQQEGQRRDSAEIWDPSSTRYARAYAATHHRSGRSPNAPGDVNKQASQYVSPLARQSSMRSEAAEALRRRFLASKLAAAKGKGSAPTPTQRSAAAAQDFHAGPSAAHPAISSSAAAERQTGAQGNSVSEVAMQAMELQQLGKRQSPWPSLTSETSDVPWSRRRSEQASGSASSLNDAWEAGLGSTRDNSKADTRKVSSIRDAAVGSLQLSSSPILPSLVQSHDEICRDTDTGRGGSVAETAVPTLCTPSAAAAGDASNTGDVHHSHASSFEGPLALETDSVSQEAALTAQQRTFPVELKALEAILEPSPTAATDSNNTAIIATSTPGSDPMHSPSIVSPWPDGSGSNSKLEDVPLTSTRPAASSPHPPKMGRKALRCAMQNLPLGYVAQCTAKGASRSCSTSYAGHMPFFLPNCAMISSTELGSPSESTLIGNSTSPVMSRYSTSMCNPGESGPLALSSGPFAGTGDHLTSAIGGHRMLMMLSAFPARQSPVAAPLLPASVEGGEPNCNGSVGGGNTSHAEADADAAANDPTLTSDNVPACILTRQAILSSGCSSGNCGGDAQGQPLGDAALVVLPSTHQPNTLSTTTASSIISCAFSQKQSSHISASTTMSTTTTLSSSSHAAMAPRWHAFSSVSSPSRTGAVVINGGNVASNENSSPRVAPPLLLPHPPSKERLSGHTSKASPAAPSATRHTADR
ncbi:hypothetical protein ABL78_5136 [Leptomonas seymouri]|uniref:Uncharacterized protein n=1 Tax=Leptomonas seymouri TaxID=5684 RepID=A0A0N1PCM3_LEPSE|nr:hypothetical protein ABL78_5136 [Leptomonas seymouri]|eukprot:KPI85808.1 hypothetical protein ABL78_5136 [Leptomonas seymouri]